MDSSGDDIEENEILFHTINSQLNIFIKFLVGLLINLTSSTQYNQLFNFIMGLEILILFATIICLILFFHSFDCYLGHLQNYFFQNVIKKYQTFYASQKIGSSKLLSSQVSFLSLKNIGFYALQGRRPKMEDTFSYLNESKRLHIQMFGVFDGHGGDTASKIVQSRLLTSILNSFEKSFHENQNQKQLLNSLSCCAVDEINLESNLLNETFCKTESYEKKSANEDFNLKIKQYIKIIKDEIINLDKVLVKEMKEKEDFSGTTALLAVNMLKENILIVANVGDSRAVLCDSNGNVVPLSYDHKPEQPSEQKRIEEAGGFIRFNGVWRVAGILATSRALGDYPLKANNLVIPDPDIFFYNCNHIKPQFVILASDGLWDSFSNKEAVDYVKTNLELLRKNKKDDKDIAFELAKNLTLQSYKKGSWDNITVVIVLFTNSFTNKK